MAARAKSRSSVESGRTNQPCLGGFCRLPPQGHAVGALGLDAGAGVAGAVLRKAGEAHAVVARAMVHTALRGGQRLAELGVDLGQLLTRLGRVLVGADLDLPIAALG